MKHKKFMDIVRVVPKYVGGFSVGDEIWCEEKVDGANAGIRYDNETNAVVAQSRKQILTPENNLRGFYEFTQKLDVQKVKDVLGTNLVLFGEWLVPHSIKYPEDRYNNFYAYDAYDTEKEEYLPQQVAMEMTARLGLTFVPVFYVGPFESWEKIQEMVGKTDMGGSFGEGVVIKNQTKLNDPNSRNPFYIKIVGEEFCETKDHKIKQVDPEKLAAQVEARAKAETIVTPARVRKILHKLVDEGILPEDWGSEQMSIVAKNLSKMVYADCVKEENDTVLEIENFGKLCGSISMEIARQVLKEKENL